MLDVYSALDALAGTRIQCEEHTCQRLRHGLGCPSRRYVLAWSPGHSPRGNAHWFVSGFLLFRVLKTGSDTRFDDIRSHFFKFFGFWIGGHKHSLSMAHRIHRPFTGQIIWVWTVSLPIIILNSPKVTDGQAPSFGQASDILGIIIWVIGWLIESVADLQKFRHKSTRPPKEQPIDVSIFQSAGPAPHIC